MKKCFVLLVAVLMLISSNLSAIINPIWMSNPQKQMWENECIFTPDDKYIIGTNVLGGGVTPVDSSKVYKVETGEIVNRTMPGLRRAHILDSNHVIGAWNNEIRVINLTTFQLERLFELDSFQMSNDYGEFDYSLDNSQMITHFYPSKINNLYGFRIWDIKTGKIIRTKFFPNDTNAYSFSVGWVGYLYNGNILAGLNRHYKIPDGKGGYKDIDYYSNIILDKNTLDSIGSTVIFSYISPDKDLLLWSSNTLLTIYDAKTMQVYKTLPMIEAPSDYCFSKDQRYLYLGFGGHKRIEIWDLITSSMLDYTSYVDANYSGLAISNNQKYFAAAYGIVFMYYNPIKGVVEPPKQDSLIFPNPANGNINLNFSTNNNLPTITSLNDLSGHLIKPLFNQLLDIGSHSLQFNVSDLSNGTYFITVQNGKDTQSFKLLINK
ncbi:MAG: T9SS type A sorting domain-containing protein [Candidatus Kapabacteria bacterium]|nr:T9SS type A sorting domain-containing protein [Candidatus Kapabacteria bacterium]